MDDDKNISEERSSRQKEQDKDRRPKKTSDVQDAKRPRAAGAKQAQMSAGKPHRAGGSTQDSKPYNKAGDRARKPYEATSRQHAQNSSDSKARMHAHSKQDVAKVPQSAAPQIRSKVFFDPRTQSSQNDNARETVAVYGGVTILYEDNSILVAVKPIGMPVQSDLSGENDMLSTLKRYLAAKYNKPGDAYLGLVHRLDRPVGGVMVFARNSKSAARLSEAIRNHEIEKRYFAILEGVPEIKVQTLVNYLKQYPDNFVRIAPELEQDAKYAELSYKILETSRLRTGDDVSLAQIRLVTGKKHQIRVQFSTIGHPLVGDRKYGNKLKDVGSAACLYSVQLRFEHPVTHTLMTFRVYPPDVYPWNLFDMEQHLKVSLQSTDDYEGASYLDALSHIAEMLPDDDSTSE